MERPVAKSPVACWDVTIPADYATKDQIVETLTTHAKDWAFQKERGSTTGYEHWQVRLSLKEKDRKPWMKFWPDKCFFGITSMGGSKKFNYVMKDETRIDGPWTSESMTEDYIPRQIRAITQLRPWQAQLLEWVDETKHPFDDRHVNCLVDPIGRNGKSTVANYGEAHKLCNILPFQNDYRDVCRMVMGMPTSKMYIVDIERSIPIKKMGPFWGAIESVKNGRVYDDRYSYKMKRFDSPVIWVFMNRFPKKGYFSHDRWVFWSIDKETDSLVETPYTNDEEDHDEVPTSSKRRRTE